MQLWFVFIDAIFGGDFFFVQQILRHDVRIAHIRNGDERGAENKREKQGYCTFHR